MKALNDIVLIEVDQEPIRTPAGIVLSEKAAGIGPIGKILDVGEGVDIDIKPGDWVMFDTRFVQNELVKGVPYRWTRQVGVLAKLNQAEIDAEIVDIPEEQESMIVPATTESVC